MRRGSCALNLLQRVCSQHVKFIALLAGIPGSAQLSRASRVFFGQKVLATRHGLMRTADLQPGAAAIPKLFRLSACFPYNCSRCSWEFDREPER